nr:extracellular solute-binding protein [Natranaeroarchaeum aerophilus]
MAGCVEDETPTDIDDENDDSNGQDENGQEEDGGVTEDDDANGEERSEEDEDEDDEADAETGEGDLSVWHDFNSTTETSFTHWTDEFEAETGLDIAVTEVADLEDRIETGVPSGEAPEMWPWLHDWVDNHWDRGFLADVSGDLTIDLDAEFTDAAVEAVQPSGTDAVVGLPYAGETMTLFYNPELIDEPPETYDEMLTIAQEFHNPQYGEYGITHPVDVYFISWALQAFGSRIFEVNDAGEPQLGLEEDSMHEGMALFRELYNYMPRDLFYDPQISAFANGDAPLHFNGPWAVRDFNDRDTEFAVAELPAIEGGSATPFAGIDVWYFSSMINEDDDRKEASIEFGEWFTTTDEIVEHHAEEYGHVPVTTSVNENELPDDVRGFYHAMEQGVPMPADPRMNQVWQPLEDAISNILIDDADIADEFGAAAASIRAAWE